MAILSENMTNITDLILPDGRKFAKSVIPEGWSVKTERQDMYNSIDKPFTLSVLYTDGKDTILVRTGEKYLDILQSFNALVDAFSPGKQSKLMPMNMFRQMTPEAYLDEAAIRTYRGVQLTPQAISNLPSVFGSHPEFMRQMLETKYGFQRGWDLSFTNPVAEPVLTGLEYKSLLKKYTFNTDGIFLFGVDTNAMHYENRSTGGGYAGGLVSGLFSRGKGVYTVWGSEIIFALITKAERETKSTKAFLEVVESFILDTSVQQEIFTLANHWNQQVYNQQQAANAMAVNLRRQNMMNQARLTQTLTDNANQMNAMIMDSWEKRSVSMDHISSMQQEATMGVNSYIRTDGSTVQHSVTSDHVFENKYGDTVGVSGYSEDFRTSLNWVEIHRK